MRDASRLIFSGELTADSIEAMFKAPATEDPRSARATGRKANREVALLLRNHATGRSFKCHDLKPRRVALSAEHSITVSPGFYFVEQGTVKIFWLQPRKTYALSLPQMGILNGLLRLSHFRDDFEHAELELLDMSAVDGVRVPKAFARTDLPIPSEDELSVGLEHLLRAYLLLADRDDLRPERPSREPAASQPTLFE